MRFHLCIVERIVWVYFLLVRVKYVRQEREQSHVVIAKHAVRVWFGSDGVQ